jgi:hypothetical protein
MAGAPIGNSNAARAKIWSDAVRKVVLSGGKLEPLAKKLVQLAENGDLAALKEVADRLEGKAVQQVEASGPEGGPIQHQMVEVLIVDPASPGSTQA